MKQYTIEKLRKDNLIIFEGTGGSHAYGTSTPSSDIDTRGVFIQPLEDILSYGYVDQVTDVSNDTIFYELKRFMDLLEKNNPNILEILNLPDDCIRHKDPLFNIITENRKSFLTKACRLTFAGYAIEQIKKARGYNKKINWEESKMTRKTVLDFCYILQHNGTIPLNDFLNKLNAYQATNRTYKDYALSAMDHAHNLYAMFYLPSQVSSDTGIVSDPETSNDVKLGNIPKECALVAYLAFNKDAYSTHCKNYKEYKEWLNNRNEDRFKLNKEHGKNYDSKNMTHVYRLLSMSIDIAEKKEIVVRRPQEEIEKLMKIRNGEYDYDDLINEAEEMIKNLDEAFDKSSLSEKIENDLIAKTLFDIRKKWYKL